MAEIPNDTDRVPTQVEHGATLLNRYGRCDLLSLPIVHDPRGNLTALESGPWIPFEFARVYFTYSIPAGASRGGHAHRECQELIVATAGSFDITIDDGKDSHRVHLDRPNLGLSVPRLVWRELDSFTAGSVCMVIASIAFDPDEYIRDFEEFSREYADSDLAETISDDR